MSSSNKIKRQAVVIIHGMGEQKPMDTLRSFVKGIKSHLEKHDESEKKTVIRSKPDGISDIYETRRLSLSASRNRPITDFYEFYWAHNMRNNKFIDISAWLLKLLFSKTTKIPKRLIPVWWTIWIFLFLITIISVLLLLNHGVEKIKTFMSTLVILPTIFSLITLTIKSLFLNSVGDAGRYFTPSPGNVGERSNIRRQGISFLKRMNENSGNEKYGRIIIVAHSLGCVVAYDLLKLLWTDYNESHENVTEIDQHAISEIEQYYKEGLKLTDINLFQNLQYKCWLQQKAIGNKWLISDFITLGAPLCNADYLIPNNVSFEELKTQREFPTCPPVPDDVTNTIHYDSKPYDIEGGKRTVKILHHAALFAVTRWTNIYFSSDFVGGPMHRLFGKAVKDECVTRKSLWFYPGGHTHYWDINSVESLAKIVNALRLKEES